MSLSLYFFVKNNILRAFLWACIFLLRIIFCVRFFEFVLFCSVGRGAEKEGGGGRGGGGAKSEWGKGRRTLNCFREATLLDPYDIHDILIY